MSKEKKYFLSVVEEMIQNPKFEGFRAGRVEVFKKGSKSGYAIGEGRFLIPEKMIDIFRAMLDFKEVDLPIRIDLDIFKYDEKAHKKYYGGR